MTYVSSIVTRRPWLGRVETGGVWWPVAPLWRWIRKGPELRDRDLIDVVYAIADTIRTHLFSAKGILPARLHPGVDVLIAQFDKAVEADIPDLTALLAIDSRINALYPPALAAKRDWMIRERFERVASSRAIEEWWLHGQNGNAGAVPPPDPVDAPVAELDALEAESRPVETKIVAGVETSDAPISEPVKQELALAPQHSGGDQPQPPTNPSICAESKQVSRGPNVSVMLSYIHSNYIMGIARQKAERDLKCWLIRQVWFGLAALIVFVIAVPPIIKPIWPRTSDEITGAVIILFLVSLLGRMGALVSISQRLQRVVGDNVLAQDVVQELAALRAGRAGVRLALMSGSIFALLVWVLFASGIPALIGMEKGLFPTPLPPAEIRRLVDVKAATVAADALATARVAGTAPGAIVAQPVVTSSPAQGDAMQKALRQLQEGQAMSALARNDLVLLDAAARARKVDVEKLPPGAGIWSDTDKVSTTLGFAHGSDLLLLLLWGFIAGFAERFVPDALDRIVGAMRRPVTPKP